jgi:acetyltransferase-like isoleucine patch superfamily enzyme
MMIFADVPFKLTRFISNWYIQKYNNQYFRYRGVHPSVKFGAAYPAIVHIAHPENISIGEGSVINGDSVLDALGGISIGRYVHCGRGLAIYSSNHNFRSHESIPYDSQHILKKVTIHDYVWIGANVSIRPGVTIAEGAIIAMGTAVTADVPECAIIGGGANRIFGYRDNDTFIRLKRDNKFF